MYRSKSEDEKNFIKLSTKLHSNDTTDVTATRTTFTTGAGADETVVLYATAVVVTTTTTAVLVVVVTVVVVGLHTRVVRVLRARAMEVRTKRCPYMD